MEQSVTKIDIKMDAHFNELSLKTYFSSKENVTQSFKTLLETFKRLKNYGFSRLRFDKEIHELFFLQNYSIKDWLYDGKQDNYKTLLLGIYTRPFIDDNRDDLLAEFAKTKVVIKLEDDSYVDGLGVLGAYLSQSLTIGFFHDKYWMQNTFQIKVSIDDQELKEEKINNVYSPESVDSIDSETVVYLGLKKEITSIKSFVDLLGTNFPSLLFCENAKNQILNIGIGDIRLNTLMKKLIRLNIHASLWSDGAYDFKSLGIDCSPDTPDRINKSKQKRTFLCPDGIQRIFSLHCKWSIGSDEVRLYFFPDPEKKKLIIGYIGNKSGIGF